MSEDEPRVGDRGPLPEEATRQLEAEVARLRDLAVKSRDPIVIAKAIAIGDEDILEVVRGRLAAGERLVEVFGFAGAGKDATEEVRVFIRFLPADDGVHLVDAGVLAYVDLAAGEVVGIVDPFILQPEERSGRPLVSIAALDTSRFAASRQDMKPVLDAEREFFEAAGIARFRFPIWDWLGGITTVKDTPIRTETRTPGQKWWDDSRNEETDDYVDSAPGSILA